MPRLLLEIAWERFRGEERGAKRRPEPVGQFPAFKIPVHIPLGFSFALRSQVFYSVFESLPSTYAQRLSVVRTKFNIGAPWCQHLFMNKNERIVARVSAEEKARIEACAAKSGMDASTYLRRCCLSGVIFRTVVEGWPQGTLGQGGGIPVTDEVQARLPDEEQSQKPEQPHHKKKAGRTFHHG